MVLASLGCMARPSQRALVHALLDRYGQTYAAETGILIDKNTPAPLFQLLCTSLLLSARIRAQNAVSAMRALIDAGLTTPEKMGAASWQDRVDVITSHGYKRYDGIAATQLGQAAELVLDRYHGDLRRLRDEAERDVDRERTLLMEVNGIGPVGADIFLREVQGIWDEVYPFADERVLHAARLLELGRSAGALSRLVPPEQFPRLVAALIRVDLSGGYDAVRQAA